MRLPNAQAHLQETSIAQSLLKETSPAQAHMHARDFQCSITTERDF